MKVKAQIAPESIVAALGHVLVDEIDEVLWIVHYISVGAGADEATGRVVFSDHGVVVAPDAADHHAVVRHHAPADGALTFRAAPNGRRR